MTIAAMLAIVAGAGLLQSVIPGWSFLGMAKAPILLCVVLYYALTRSRGMVLVCAILAGVAQDALSQIPLGYSSFCFCIAGLAANRFKDVVFTDSVITAGVFGAVAAGVVTAGLGVFLVNGGQVSDPFWQSAWRVVGSSVLGLFFTPVVFRVSVWLDRQAGNVAPEKGPFGDKIRYT